jgi:uncharacterized protein (DUF169 family)
MNHFAALDAVLSNTLRLTRRPVGIAFLDTPPSGVDAFIGMRPSGCSFWSLAAQGRAFYTVASDHHNCAIGSYTHNIQLPTTREPELEQTLSFMNEIGYIRMEEVPAIPRLVKTPGAIVYAPLRDIPVKPDVIILTGTPGGLMQLQEAAAARGITAHPLIGRPTCMALPAAQSGGLFTSIGCVGNRVYTDLSDGELYAVVEHDQLTEIVGALETVVAANQKLAEFHRQRQTDLTD